MAAFIAGIFVGRHSGYCKEVGRLLLIGGIRHRARDGVLGMFNRSLGGRVIRRAAASLLTATALLVSPLLATSSWATMLVSSIPNAGAILNEAPSAISLTTDLPLLDQGSSITVTDPAGNRVDDGSLTIDATNATVGLGDLTRSGMYKVTYTLVVDGDVPASGSYSFLFNAPSAITSVSPTPTPVATQSSTPASTSSGSSGGKIFVIVLLVLSLFVGIFLLWYARMIIRDVKDRQRKSAKPRSRTAQSPTNRSKKTEE